ncbi:MAG: DUF4352 domain-containing protein [Nitrosarchaeum sp.]|nr:DUF4352 domain-containing protein [Nitrosarchaeum sp.]
MVQITVFIVIGAIIISMAAAMYTYTQNQTNFITANAGEPIIVGPVEYTISFDGTSKGTKEIVPENTFVKIKITAKNISKENTILSGGQFFLIDDKQKKHLPADGGFSADGLLEPNKPVTVTTQFDVPYDDLKKYNVLIHPAKQQTSVDIALICIINC